MGPVQEAMPGLRSSDASGAGQAVLLEGARREAMSRAGRLLASRPRSEQEITDRLTDAGFEPAIVEAVVERLRELRLVDDAEFALQWVEDRGARKKLSAAALVHELAARGVSGEVAEAALARAGLDEAAQAAELAATYVRRVASRPLAEQFARIRQMLVRRGYSSETAEEAVRAVLPPEGWD